MHVMVRCQICLLQVTCEGWHLLVNLFTIRVLTIPFAQLIFLAAGGGKHDMGGQVRIWFAGTHKISTKHFRNSGPIYSWGCRWARCAIISYNHGSSSLETGAEFYSLRSCVDYCWAVVLAHFPRKFGSWSDSRKRWNFYYTVYPASLESTFETSGAFIISMSN